MTPTSKPPFQFGLAALFFGLAALFVVMSLVAASFSQPGVFVIWVAFAATRAWAADGDRTGLPSATQA